MRSIRTPGRSMAYLGPPACPQARSVDKRMKIQSFPPPKLGCFIKGKGVFFAPIAGMDFRLHVGRMSTINGA